MPKLSDTIRNLDAVSRGARRAKRDLAGITGASVSAGVGGDAGTGSVDIAPIVARLAKIDRQTARGDTFQQRARKLGL